VWVLLFSRAAIIGCGGHDGFERKFVAETEDSTIAIIILAIGHLNSHNI
jgi:hypothetical protein